MPQKTRPRTKKEWPSDPLERCHLRWVALFFGVWRALRMRDPKLVSGLLLALEKAGLAAYQGDTLTFVPGLTDLNPADGVLKKVTQFRQTAIFPALRGRLRSGHTRPPYLNILMEYYRALFAKRSGSAARKLRGDLTPHEEAVRLVAENTGYTEQAVSKHLEKARRLFPELARLWAGTGTEWIQSA